MMREIEAVMGAQALSALVLFDAIIANRNTHLGNFKMLVDNNLLLRSAPIFDNGRAFFNHIRGFSKGGFVKYLRLTNPYLTDHLDRHFDKLVAIHAAHKSLEVLDKL